MAETKKALLGLSLTELKEVAKSLGMPAFKADRGQNGSTRNMSQPSTT